MVREVYGLEVRVTEAWRIGFRGFIPRAKWTEALMGLIDKGSGFIVLGLGVQIHVFDCVREFEDLVRLGMECEGLVCTFGQVAQEP